MITFLKSIIVCFFMFTFATHAAQNHDRIIVTDYSSYSSSTAIYSEVVPSIEVTTGSVLMCDTSGKLIRFATWSVGYEVDAFTNFISGCVLIPTYLVKGTRLSMKPVDAVPSSGFNTISLIKN